VEEAGGVGRRHEAPVDLGIDADILVDLAVRHLDLEGARRLVVAHRAQLRGIHALALHQTFSTRIFWPALMPASRRASPASVPSTLQRAASLGRSSVEIGVRPEGRRSASPSVQKHTVPGSTTCCASASSRTLTGVVKYTSSPQVCALASKGSAAASARVVGVSRISTSSASLPAVM